MDQSLELGGGRWHVGNPDPVRVRPPLELRFENWQVSDTYELIQRWSWWLTWRYVGKFKLYEERQIDTYWQPVTIHGHDAEMER